MNVVRGLHVGPGAPCRRGARSPAQSDEIERAPWPARFIAPQVRAAAMFGFPTSGRRGIEIRSAPTTCSSPCGHYIQKPRRRADGILSAWPGRHRLQPGVDLECARRIAPASRAFVGQAVRGSRRAAGTLRCSDAASRWPAAGCRAHETAGIDSSAGLDDTRRHPPDQRRQNTIRRGEGQRRSSCENASLDDVHLAR